MVSRWNPFFWAGLLCLGLLPALSPAAEQLYEVGVAKVDITPDYAVRLSGYAARKSESQGVAQHIYAKALAFGGKEKEQAVLVTVDNCGVPLNVREEVVARLSKKKKVRPERIAICSSHTHSAPLLAGYLSNLFGNPLPAEEQAHVDRYTRELTDALEKVASQALESCRSAILKRGVGRAGFAANRRTKGGPVDQEVPALFVFERDGTLRAVYASYACHCTTLTGEFNQVCGDWAGYAQEFIEADHPGSVALISLGCAGDANPNPRPGFELAKQHGRELATAVGKVYAGVLTPVEGKLSCRTKQLQLPYDTLPTRAELEARAKDTNIYIAGHARLQLARLERGQGLDKTLGYMVQTWTFGKSFAVVFLPGEVVVDYSLRLKRELDSSRLWLNAYANDVPCYIPSERILKEGGYEGGYAMIYYDRPTRLAPGIEDRIVSAVHELLGRPFAAPPTKD